MNKKLFTSLGLTLCILTSGFNMKLLAEDKKEDEHKKPAPVATRPVQADIKSDWKKPYDAIEKLLGDIATDDAKTDLTLKPKGKAEAKLDKEKVLEMQGLFTSLKEIRESMKDCIGKEGMDSSDHFAKFLDEFVSSIKGGMKEKDSSFSFKSDEMEAYSKLILQYMGKKKTKFKSDFEQDKKLSEAITKLAEMMGVKVEDFEEFTAKEGTFFSATTALRLVGEDKKACFAKAEEKPAAKAEDKPAAKPEDKPTAKGDEKVGKQPEEKGRPAGPIGDVDGKGAGDGKGDGKGDGQGAGQGSATGNGAVNNGNGQLDLASLSGLMDRLLQDKATGLEDQIKALQRKNDDALRALEQQRLANEEALRLAKEAEKDDRAANDLAKLLQAKNGKNGKDNNAQQAVPPQIPPVSVAPPSGGSEIPPPPQPPPPPPEMPQYGQMPFAQQPSSEPIIVETRKQDVIEDTGRRRQDPYAFNNPMNNNMLELMRWQNNLMFGRGLQPFGPQQQQRGGLTVANALRGGGGASMVGRTGFAAPRTGGSTFSNGASASTAQVAPRTSAVPARISRGQNL